MEKIEKMCLKQSIFISHCVMRADDMLMSAMSKAVKSFDNVLLKHEILETAQNPNSSFPFLFDFGLGLGT